MKLAEKADTRSACAREVRLSELKVLKVKSDCVVHNIEEKDGYQGAWKERGSRDYLDCHVAHELLEDLNLACDGVLATCCQ